MVLRLRENTPCSQVQNRFLYLSVKGVLGNFDSTPFVTRSQNVHL
jgi:hypothetical protein